jgi:hypothetical protein
VVWQIAYAFFWLWVIIISVRLLRRNAPAGGHE